MKDRNWLTIDVGAVRDNILLAKSFAKDKKILGIVKANCYGLGSEIALYCEDLLDGFGVATLQEAILLRHIGIKKGILVLGGIKLDENNIREATDKGITLSLSDYESALYADSLAGSIGKKLKVQLAVDSGMSRWGFVTGDKSVFKTFLLDNLSIEGIYSHLAKADERDDAASAKQISAFEKECCEIVERTGFRGQTHILNSAGIFRYPTAFGNTARLGIAMYGYCPSEFVKAPLKPCAKWSARVVSVRRVKKGTGVSYGWIYRCDRDSTLATLAVGYADGYPRILSVAGKVYFNGKLYPVVGRVCMDQCIVNTFDDDIKTGDEVEIMGSYVSPEDIAKSCGTINYEILSGISMRTERFFEF